MEFSAEECIKFGWETFKKRPWFLVGVQILISAISFISTRIPIAGIIVSVFLNMGIIAFTLKAHDNIDTVKLRDLWAPNLFWEYLGASMLVMLYVILGFILLIVPGIIFGLMYMFVGYIIMDKSLRPGPALRESERITHGHLMELFLLWLLVGLIQIVGLLFLFVGLLVTMPVTTLALMHAYRTLEHKAGKLAPAA